MSFIFYKKNLTFWKMSISQISSRRLRKSLHEHTTKPKSWDRKNVGYLARYYITSPPIKYDGVQIIVTTPLLVCATINFTPLIRELKKSVGVILL
jgi:hypothetical protein